MDLENIGEYPALCLEILSYMKERWPNHLSYHSIAHIIDVANVCETYIKHYDIDKDNADLIRIAAISHDIGYLKSPENHEALGIEIIAPFLEKDLCKRQIDAVNGMIMATKVPQEPTTFYEEIIADADLDYLGRNDYDALSQNLYQEFLHYNVVKTDKEWLNVQVNFLEKHHFHTAYAKKHRFPIKQLKLAELKEKQTKTLG